MLSIIIFLVAEEHNWFGCNADCSISVISTDSLGGNARTTMVANMGPAAYNYDESLSTLRYANRAKNIKNKPKINEDPKDALLREFQEEIGKLKVGLVEGFIVVVSASTGYMKKELSSNFQCLENVLLHHRTSIYMSIFVNLDFSSLLVFF